MLKEAGAMKPAPTTAILLAAGRGERLRPYTDHTPKPLLRVDGRPTLDYVLSAVAHARIRTVCLVTHHLTEQIEQYVKDGSAWGLQVVFCRQPQLSGTACALSTVVSTCPGLISKTYPFLLTATDYVFPLFYLADLITAYQHHSADITLSLKKLPEKEIVGRSNVQFHPNGQVARIIEKPAMADITSPFVASLTFVLPGAILDYLSCVVPSPRGEFEIQTVINQMLNDGFTAYGLVQETPREWGPHDHE